MSKIWEIWGLVLLIIVVVVAFPQEAGRIFQNRFYTLIGGLVAFLILFFVWLQLRTRY
jgi:uncharacterized membrane protein YccC